jgi:hypothetical protein
MGGNEGEIDAAIFSLLVGASGQPGRRRKAGRRRRRAHPASVREEEEGMRWAGPAGRPWPSGGGEENRPVKEKEDWAERPGGPKVTRRILF